MEIKTEIENIKECLAGYVGGVYAQAYAAIEFLENELETLRASNTIKQANIELLEAENAKLITERKEYLVNKVFESSDKKLLANHGFTDFIELLAAYEKLLAGRDGLKAENTRLTEQRDSFRKTASGMSDLLRAVAVIAGTEEYDDDFSVTITALEAMKQEREAMGIKNEQ